MQLPVKLTLLQYILIRLFGLPEEYKAPGHCTWKHCPFCEKRGFYTRPYNGVDKDRYRCTNCGARGDAVDILLFPHPSTSYHYRLSLLDTQWRPEYERNVSIENRLDNYRTLAGLAKP